MKLLIDTEKQTITVVDGTIEEANNFANASEMRFYEVILNDVDVNEEGLVKIDEITNSSGKKYNVYI